MELPEVPTLHSVLGFVDHDALDLDSIGEYLSTEERGMTDVCDDVPGHLNFAFIEDQIQNQDLLNPLNHTTGAAYNADLPNLSTGHPIDIPGLGGQRQGRTFPLTPPHSDGPDSPDEDQVLVNGVLHGKEDHFHNLMLSSWPNSQGLQQLQMTAMQQEQSFNYLPELTMQLTNGVCEPKKKRKRDSETETVTATGISSLKLGSVKLEPDDYFLDGSSSESSDSPDSLSTMATLDSESSYQCPKWSSFKADKWSSVYDESFNAIPTPQCRVDADKGFNFSIADDAFVCQKKNHLQITAFLTMDSVPKYVQGKDSRLINIEKICLHLYGVKMESQASRIGIEQSQTDRSKKHYDPAQILISPREQAKVTVGRLHFSETTSNNMRKKGKPNPDQRYFLFVVAVHAHTSNDEFLVCANVSERIIVRASNPGQFENDAEVVWSRGHTADSVFRMGRVGINTDKPGEALSVNGNLKVTGQLVHPSDVRVKESIQEVDSKEQLRNVVRMKLYKYRFSREFLEHAGLATDDCEGEDTGVLAQEVQEVLPEAVKESDDLVLPDGKTIERFLVVNKERIFMENVGAVKELCKLTDNLEVRIDELETVNKKLQRKRCDTASTFSSISLSRTSSFRASISSKKQTTEYRKKCHSSHHQHHHHHHHCHHCHSHYPCAQHPSHAVVYEEPGWCSPRVMQILIITLVFVMVLSIGGMATLYIMQDRNQALPDSTSGGGQGSVGAGFPTSRLNASTLPSITTQEPSSSEPTVMATHEPVKQTTASPTFPRVIVTTGRGLTSHTSDRNLSLTSTQRPTISPGKFIPTTRHMTTLSEAPSERKTKGPTASQCCSQKNSEYPAQLLQGIDVYYEKSNLAPGTSNGQTSDPELRILENNYMIKYSNDSIYNTSRYIPFSAGLPFQAVTLEINSTSNTLVLLCSTSNKFDCPEHKTQPPLDTVLKQDSWKKCHRWQLPVAYYYQSTYHFRVVSSRGDTCQTPSNPSGAPIPFKDFYFYFIRKCKV